MAGLRTRRGIRPVRIFLDVLAVPLSTNEWALISRVFPMHACSCSRFRRLLSAPSDRLYSQVKAILILRADASSFPFVPHFEGMERLHPASHDSQWRCRSLFLKCLYNLIYFLNICTMPAGLPLANDTMNAHGLVFHLCAVLCALQRSNCSTAITGPWP